MMTGKMGEVKYTHIKVRLEEEHSSSGINHKLCQKNIVNPSPHCYFLIPHNNLSLHSLMTVTSFVHDPKYSGSQFPHYCGYRGQGCYLAFKNITEVFKNSLRKK